MFVENKMYQTRYLIKDSMRSPIAALTRTLQGHSVCRVTHKGFDPLQPKGLPSQQTKHVSPVKHIAVLELSDWRDVRLGILCTIFLIHSFTHTHSLWRLDMPKCTDVAKM